MSGVCDVEVPDELSELANFQELLANIDPTNSEKVQTIKQFFLEYPNLAIFEFYISTLIYPYNYIKYCKLIEQLPIIVIKLLFSNFGFPEIFFSLIDKYCTSKCVLDNIQKSFSTDRFHYINYQNPVFERYNGYLAEIPKEVDICEVFINDDLDAFIQLEDKLKYKAKYHNIAAIFRSVNIFKYLITVYDFHGDIQDSVIIGGSFEIFRLCTQKGVNFSNKANVALLFRRDELFDHLNQGKQITTSYPSVSIKAFLKEPNLKPECYNYFFQICALDNYNSIFNYVRDVDNAILYISDKNVISKICENNLTKYIDIAIENTSKFLFDVLMESPNFAKSFIKCRSKTNQLAFFEENFDKNILEKLPDNEKIKFMVYLLKNRSTKFIDPQGALGAIRLSNYDSLATKLVIETPFLLKSFTSEEKIEIFNHVPSFTLLAALICPDVSDEQIYSLLEFAMYSQKNPGTLPCDLVIYLLQNSYIKQKLTALDILALIRYSDNSDSTAELIKFVKEIACASLPPFIYSRSEIFKFFLQSQYFEKNADLDKAIKSYPVLHEIFPFIDQFILTKEQFYTVIKRGTPMKDFPISIGREIYSQYFDYKRLLDMNATNVIPFLYMTEESVDQIRKLNDLRHYSSINVIQLIPFSEFQNTYNSTTVYYREGSYFMLRNFTDEEIPLVVSALANDPHLYHMAAQNDALINKFSVDTLIQIALEIKEKTPNKIIELIFNKSENDLPRRFYNLLISIDRFYDFIIQYLPRMPPTMQLFYDIIRNAPLSQETIVADPAYFVRFCSLSQYQTATIKLIETAKVSFPAIVNGFGAALGNQCQSLQRYILSNYDIPCNFNFCNGQNILKTIKYMNKLLLTDKYQKYLDDYQMKPKKYVSEFSIFDRDFVPRLLHKLPRDVSDLFKNQNKDTNALIEFITSSYLADETVYFIMCYFIDPHLVNKIRSSLSPDEYAATRNLVFQILKDKSPLAEQIEKIYTGQTLSDFTPYDQFYMLATQCNNIEFMKSLLAVRDYKEVAKNTDIIQPIVLSIQLRNNEIFDLLVDSGIDLNGVFAIDNTQQSTLINYAITYNNIHCFDKLLEKKVSTRFIYEISPFCLAIDKYQFNRYFAQHLAPLIDVSQELIFNFDVETYIEQIKNNEELKADLNPMVKYLMPNINHYY